MVRSRAEEFFIEHFAMQELTNILPLLESACAVLVNATL